MKNTLIFKHFDDKTVWGWVFFQQGGGAYKEITSLLLTLGNRVESLNSVFLLHPSNVLKERKQNQNIKFSYKRWSLEYLRAV